MDRKIPGNLMGCGVTSVCALEYNEEGMGDVLVPWEPKNLVASGEIDVLLAPDWLTFLNNWRTAKGQPAVQAFDVSTSAFGYTANGQGGVAQTQAETVLARIVSEGRDDAEASDHIKASVLNAAWSSVTGKKITYCAENLVGSTKLDSFGKHITTWSMSSGHNFTMLDPDFTHAAVGIARNEAGNSVVILQLCEVPE